jgi:hypothetical protein
MFIVKVSKGVYEVREHKYPRPIFRGTMTQCVEFMRNTVPTYAYGETYE